MNAHDGNYAAEDHAFIRRLVVPPRQRPSRVKRRVLLGVSAAMLGAGAVAGLVAMNRGHIGSVHAEVSTSTSNVMNLLATAMPEDTFESLDVDRDGQLSVAEVVNRMVARLQVIKDGIAMSNVDDDTKEALNELIMNRFETGAACVGKLFESGAMLITAQSFPHVYPTLGDVCETVVIIELERAFGSGVQLVDGNTVSTIVNGNAVGP